MTHPSAAAAAAHSAAAAAHSVARDDASAAVPRGGTGAVLVLLDRLKYIFERLTTKIILKLLSSITFNQKWLRQKIAFPVN